MSNLVKPYRVCWHGPVSGVTLWIGVLTIVLSPNRHKFMINKPLHKNHACGISSSTRAIALENANSEQRSFPLNNNAAGETVSPTSGGIWFLHLCDTVGTWTIVVPWTTGPYGSGMQFTCQMAKNGYITECKLWLCPTVRVIQVQGPC